MNAPHGISPLWSVLKKREALRLLTPCVFFLAIFVLFGSKLVWDNDFWWHLKTGQYIVEHRGLPSSDPFSYAPLFYARAGLEAFTLTGYWLTQVLYYLTFSAFGFSGIHLLTALVYVTMFLLQWYWMTRERVAGTIKYLLLALGVYVMLFTFPGERPQLFSFLFSIIVVLLLEEFRKTGKGLAILPGVMILWANMHPGFVIGIGMICMYILLEGIKLARSGGVSSSAQYRRLVIWGAVSVAASAVNPNIYYVVPQLLAPQNSAIGRDVTEWQNMYTILVQYRWTEPVVLAAVIALLAAAGFIASRRTLEPVHVVLAAGCLLAGGYMYRLFAFTVVLGIPIIGIYLGKSMDDLNKRPLCAAGGRYVSIIAQGAVVVLSLAIVGVFLRERMFLENDYNRNEVPVKAVDFMGMHDIKGNIFNHYNSGGYLIWRLYPRNRVFIDGRAISEEAYATHNAILWGEQGSQGDPLRWDALLESFGLNVVLLSPLDEVSGEVFPLLHALVRAGSWRLVYYDERDLIFVREGVMNSEVIKIFNLPKERAYFTVIALAEKGIAREPDKTNNYISKGLALRALGRDEESEEVMKGVREMLPKIKGGFGLP